MNEIIESLYHRKSMRVFEEKAIPDERKGEILQAALQAPSAGCAPRKPGAGDLMLAVMDATIAAQNAVVAAESLGIGSCYIGDIMENCEAQRTILQLPEYVFPAAMLVFGWPTSQQKNRPKPKRVDLKYILHENSYPHMDGEELKEMYAEQCGNQTFEEWATAFCNRKYNSDFSREMTRSVEQYLEQFRK